MFPIVNKSVDRVRNLWFTVGNLWFIEVNMKVDDLKVYYSAKSDAELAEKLQRSRGAISKWRSRGIPLSTQAVLQIQTKGKVKANLAMTGEITLRGKVLPVGGIKEKILAAKRAGIKEIILSDENRKNIEEIQDIYLKGLTFHYVKDIKEVFAIALTDEKVADAIDLSVKKEKTEKKEE